MAQLKFLGLIVSDYLLVPKAILITSRFRTDGDLIHKTVRLPISAIQCLHARLSTEDQRS